MFYEKRPFLAYFCDQTEKNSSGNWTILEIDAFHTAHFEADVELCDTSKIVGPSPLRSHLIRNHDRKNECF